MKLISCDNCGVIIDADKIQWPDAYEAEHCGGEGAEWDGEKYVAWVAWVACPVCKCRIKEQL